MVNRERRKEIRINQHNTFQFTIAHSSPVDLTCPPTMSGQLVDYSAAGIRFITNARLDKNVSINIRLNLDSFDNEAIDWRDLWQTGDEPYLNVIGSVMWCLNNKEDSNKFEVGTRFTQKALES